MLELIFTLMVALVPLQRNRWRFVAAFSLVGGAVLHNAFLGDAVGLLYYGSAALVDIGVLAVIVALPKTDLPVRLLGLSCIISASLNAIGWVLWFTYLPSKPYNVAFVVLYIFVLYALCLGVVSGCGHSRSDSRFLDFFFPAHKRRFSFRSVVGGGSKQ